MTRSKKISHKYKYGGRVLNWRVVVIVATILFCLVAGSHVDDDNTYVREPDEMAVFMTATVVDHPEDESVETKIRKYFPKHWRDFIQIAHAESQMKVDAVGYNCYYYHGKATTTPIKGGSKACKKEDRSLAWSLDCGLMQLNTLSKKCPKRDSSEEYLDEHLKVAAQLSREQGKCAWYGYAKWEQECD